jgi:Glyoxalase/Bleomycin resistance protein/Dioxygenase superfamily
MGIRREDHMAIEIRGMAPLLQVFDMPTSIAFYRDVLGFEVERTDGGEMATPVPRAGCMAFWEGPILAEIHGCS